MSHALLVDGGADEIRDLLHQVVGVLEERAHARAELADLIKDMTAQMMAAARDLQFELAARIRDEIADLKKELRGMDAAGLK